MNASRTYPAEEELLLRLAGTRLKRATDHERIVALAGRCDYAVLSALAAQHGMTIALGRRLIKLAPEVVPTSFAEELDRAEPAGRHRAALLEQMTLRLVTLLERSAIETLPLKGPLLSERLYGDPGARGSSDVDLLVGRANLDAVVSALAEQGYRPPADPAVVDGLPHLHYTLSPTRSWLPTVEIHWRLHWYETSFSDGLLDRTRTGPDGRGALAPVDDMATLLLFFARDGFAGLRYAADIAACWDLHEDALEQGALDPLFMAHPELRPALTTAVAVAERLVGVPAARLLELHWLRTARGRRAERLANWSRTGGKDQVSANVTLVDWLLTPRGGHRAFVARHVLPTADALSASRELPRDARVRRTRLRLAHAGKLVIRYLYALWRVRGGREWTRPA